MLPFIKFVSGFNFGGAKFTENFLFFANKFDSLIHADQNVINFETLLQGKAIIKNLILSMCCSHLHHNLIGRL